MTRAELIEALETAQGADRGLFIAAFDCCHPAPCGAVGGPVPDAYYAWLRVKDRFCHLLNTDAYLDAAMMLVPEGCTWSAGDWSAIAKGASATCWPPEDRRPPNYNGICHAATPALALAAACLRAGGE